MSDYQFAHFLACDAPLGKKQLAFMRKQSKSPNTTEWEFIDEYPERQYGGPVHRLAKITEWEFIDEYHGEFDGGNFFQGNHWEMLQHGYDAHLDYFNFGIRSLEFHLPDGAPGGQKLMTAFESTRGAEWSADHNHHGPLAKDEWTMPGILSLNPLCETDDAFHKAPLDPTCLLAQIAPVRKALARGDLRPLYLCWLAGYYDPKDEDQLEPPVPAGLYSLTPPLQAMATFYGLTPELIAAAAARSPALPDRDVPAMQWPVAEPARTLTQLRKTAAPARRRRVTRAKKTAPPRSANAKQSTRRRER